MELAGIRLGAALDATGIFLLYRKRQVAWQQAVFSNGIAAITPSAVAINLLFCRARFMQEESTTMFNQNITVERQEKVIPR